MVQVRNSLTNSNPTERSIILFSLVYRTSGKPIAFLLMAERATVTVCHHMTRVVAMHSRRADAVFIAVGKPGLLTADMIKPGAVVIDIGINQIDGPEGKPQVVGDCDYEACREVAGWINPVQVALDPLPLRCSCAIPFLQHAD